jgi:hypothetical protein
VRFSAELEIREGLDVKQTFCFNAETLTWGSVAYNRAFARFAAQKSPMTHSGKYPNPDLGLLFAFERRLASTKLHRVFVVSYSLLDARSQSNIGRKMLKFSRGLT